MPIARPTESAYEVASPEIRAVIDQVTAELRGTPDWSDRPAVLLEMIDALDMIVDMDADDEEVDEDDLGDDETPARATGADSLDDEEVGEAGDLDFGQLVTYYVGAVLEQLDEREITGPEQAAFYLLSCHPEHLEAAQTWLDQPGHQERFQSFVDANPDYDAVLELVEDMYDDMTDED